MIEGAQGDIRETVINDIISAMSPVVGVIQLQMLEGAVRGALRGINLEKECTELSTELDDTMHMLDVFKANKKLEGCVERTLDQYIRTAKRFFQFIGKGYRQIKKDDVKAYLFIREKLVGPNTLLNEKRNLSSLFSWLHDEGYIDKNPVKVIKGIRGEDVEMIYFTPDEEIAIRDVQCSIRDKAIIAFLFSTGVRVGEISAMIRMNVELVNGTVTFRGEKGRKKKFRTVYLDTRAKRYLADYLASRTDNNPALFVSERKYNGETKRIEKSGYEKITHKICEAAGILDRKKGTVHVFRRTFATRLAEKGCPISTIQELLGHEDPGTTMKHYVAKSKKRTQAVWEQHSAVA